MFRTSNTTYISNTIYVPASLNITNSIDMVEKLTPFLYYLSNEYIERKKYNYFTVFVKVFFPDEFVFTRIINFELRFLTREYNVSLLILKSRIKYYANECYYKVFTKPYQIHIWVADSVRDEVEEEEDELQINTIKSFKSVVCEVC